MEAELKPKVLETFDNIAATYKKLRKLEDKKVEMQVASEQFNRSQQRGYDKLRDKTIAYVKSLSLNNARIESLVEQLYSIKIVLSRTRAARFGWPTASVCRASISSTSTSATSSIRLGSTA
jgi:Sigma-70, non-essential region